MSNVVSASSPVTSQEIVLVANLLALPTSPAGQAIAKTGTTTFANVNASGGVSAVSHDATLTGLGTPASPLSVVGGGGFTIKAASGTIDDSNVVFTFASAPSLLVINGGIYQSTGGTYTWTGTTTVTLNDTIGTGGSIFGL